MTMTTRLLAAATFALALPLAGSAQTTPVPTTAPTTAPAMAAVKLDTGKWTGTVAPPGGDALAVEFNVTTAGDTTKIEMSIPQFSITLPMSQVKVEATKVTFHFTAPDQASDIACTLTKKDDGSYAGPCADGSGTDAPMTMVPPKKGAPPTP